MVAMFSTILKILAKSAYFLTFAADEVLLENQVHIPGNHLLNDVISFIVMSFLAISMCHGCYLACYIK